jgi:hypothetical protein
LELIGGKATTRWVCWTAPTLYEVIEPDLLLEIQQKAKQVDWKKLQRNMKTLCRHNTQLGQYD